MSDYGDDDRGGGGDHEYVSWRRAHSPSFAPSNHLPTFSDFDEPAFDDLDGEADGAEVEAVDDGTAGLEGDRNENVVIGGDAAARATTNAVQAIKAKQVPKDKRTTSPYMTKYERARVLGTRATQIRWARHMHDFQGAMVSVQTG